MTPKETSLSFCGVAERLPLAPIRLFKILEGFVVFAKIIKNLTECKPNQHSVVG